jgi:hypothetical protein
MRLGRRLSAGTAEDPPAPDTPEPAEVAPITAEQTSATPTGAGQREPAEQLADR